METLFTQHTSSEDELRTFGGHIAKEFSASIRLFLLIGDLGAGKTTFTQGFAKAVGCNDFVTSPTFSLIDEYPLSGTHTRLSHIDVYRIKNARELFTVGIQDILENKNMLVVVEWADKFPEVFYSHTPRLELTFTDEGGKKRKVAGVLIT